MAETNGSNARLRGAEEGASSAGTVARDRKTLEAMGSIYCLAHHAGAGKDASGLCDECRSVIDGTLARTESCPSGHALNCQDCPVKCNRGVQGERIRAIMAYAAPRMMLRHPILSLSYLKKKLAAKRV